MKFIRWCAGFFEEGPPQSSARLCAIVLTIAASYRLIRFGPSGWEAATLGAVIGGGVVALLLRRSPP